MTQPVKSPVGLGERIWSWLPERVNRAVKILAWISLVMQVLLIGTGGAVRLTASGLGCPTWPNCTDSSFVPTPQLGIYGVIEFTNRGLTGVLVVVVLLMFFAVLRLRTTRRDLFALAIVQAGLVAIQAVIGGISVLSKLSPQVVGVHFALSCILVVVATMLVWRAFTGLRGKLWASRWYVVIGWVDAGFVALTIVFGILTTGSGPHAGDALTAKGLAPRNGLNSQVIQTIHSIPAYVTFALAILLLVVAFAARDKAVWKSTRRITVAVLIVELLQIAVGLIQANEGLPVALVNIHLVLAGILVAVVSALLMSFRNPGTFAADRTL